MSDHPAARRVWTLFEMLVSIGLMGGGSYLLVLGMANKTATDSLMVLAAALCMTMGGLTLGSAIRSLLWHREMLRRAARYTSRETKIIERELLTWERAIRPADGRLRYEQTHVTANGGKGPQLGSVR